MRIILTAEELIDKGIWDEVCEMKGYNIWAVNEGLMDSDEEIPFDADMKLFVLGVTDPDPKNWHAWDEVTWTKFKEA